MTFNPLGILLTVVFAAIVWQGSRHAAALGIIAAVCYLTQGQSISLGFNFTAIRIILLVGFFRVLARKENRDWNFNFIDRCAIAYSVSILVIYTIRNGTMADFIYQAGSFYNLFLSYFVFRSLLPTTEDLKVILPRMAVIIIPFVGFLIVEATTGRDLFAIFGGVDAFAWAREGHFRARASFRSPITCGGFGAALMPLFVGGYLAGLERGKMIMGMAGCVVIVLASHSSGPLMAFLLGMIGMGFWRLRHSMKKVRWTLLIGLLTLSAIMKAPVWFLIARMGDLVGGDAYYRAELIDVFVGHFSSWWLLGAGTTQGWMPTEINGGADITNELVAAGVNGGLLSVVIFVLLIGKCFQRLGTARAMAEEHSPEDEWVVWGLGASLMAHLANQTSVTYFDQMHVIWYMALAMVAGTMVEAPESADSTTDTADAKESSPAEFAGTDRAAFT
jgi:hypothetical protein